MIYDKTKIWMGIIIILLLCAIIFTIVFYGIEKQTEEERNLQFNYGYSNGTIDTLVSIFNEIIKCNPQGVVYPLTNNSIHIKAIECG